LFCRLPAFDRPWREAARGGHVSNANLWIRTGRVAQFRNHIGSSAFHFQLRGLAPPPPPLTLRGHGSFFFGELFVGEP